MSKENISYVGHKTRSFVQSNDFTFIPQFKLLLYSSLSLIFEMAAARTVESACILVSL